MTFDDNAAPAAPTDGDVTGNDGAVSASVAEDHSLNTAIGLTASSTDPDAGDSVSYSFGFDVNGDPVLTSGLFAIDATTGVVTLAQAFDFETLGSTSVTLTIHATDESGASSSSAFTVNLANAAPSAPVDSDGASGATVSEDAAPGTIGITASASDPGGTAVTYHFKDGDGLFVQSSGAFAIDSATGVVTLTGALDYEAATSHILTVWAKDTAGGVSSSDLTVTVTNVAPSAPVDSDAGANTMQENGEDGDPTGIVLSATDVHGGTVTYALANTAGGRFRVDALTGAIVATGTVNIDYETAPLSDANGRYYEVTAEATDGTDDSTTTTFKIYITNEVEHLFDDTNNGTITDPIDFNALPNGAYDFDDNRYNAGAGNDYVILPDLATVDAGNPWDYLKTFNAGLGNDVVQGGTGNDTISGGDGDDWLFGGAGDDRLVGSAGNDILAGGDGADKLTGSSGKDIFIFTDSELGTTKVGEHDVITDFQQGTDKIDFSALYDSVAYAG